MKKYHEKMLLEKGKKALALLLAAATVTSGLPVTAYAAESSPAAAMTETSVSASSTEAGNGTVTGEQEIPAEDEVILQEAGGSQTEERAWIEIGDLDELSDVNLSVEEVNGNWRIATQYSEASENPFESVISELKNNIYYIDLFTNYSVGDLRSQLTYQWQKREPLGSYSDMEAGVVPKETGEYRLVISLDPKFAEVDPVSIDFVVEKKRLYVTYSTSDFRPEVNPGTTVGEVKAAFEAVWGLADGRHDSKVSAYKAFVEEPSLSVRVLGGTEELADGEPLWPGSDYELCLLVDVKEEYQDKYEVVPYGYILLQVNQMPETRVEIENHRLEEGEDLLRRYNGKPAAAPVSTGEDAEISIRVISEETDPSTGENKVIVPQQDELTFYWEDGAGNILEEAPTDAGRYNYKVVYNGRNYAKSENSIGVTIEPAVLTLRPAVKEEVFVGNSVDNLLRRVSYSLYDAEGKAFTEYDKNTFWGVSYRQDDNPQYYAPVFKLQMGETAVGKNKSSETVWTDVEEILYPTGVNTIDGKKKEISYRIVFAGKKGLYVDGTAQDQVDINAPINHADTNYRVDTSVLETENNVAVVEVKAGANAVIDVSAILKEGKGDSAENPVSKIYDGESLFADRSEYKKAVVKNAETQQKIAEGTDSSLRYTWYEYTLEDKELESGETVKEAILGDRVDTGYAWLPETAGDYCLKISYSDPKGRNTAEPAYVYFEIQKQLVKVVVTGSASVYSNTYVGDFKNQAAEILEYKLYLVPGNDITLPQESLTEFTQLEEWNAKDPQNPVYTAEWTVLQGDDLDPKAAEFTEIWGDGERFQEKLLYKAGVNIRFLDQLRENYTDSYEVSEGQETVTRRLCEAADITVKKMGETELEVRIDESKRGEYEKVYDGTGFDISEAVNAGYVTLVEKHTNETVPITGEDALGVQFIWRYRDRLYYDDDDYVIGYLEQIGMVSPAKAREYTLELYFGGDDTYQSVRTEIGEYLIEERNLIITPAVQKNITAGIEVGSEEFYDSVWDWSNTAISGYLEKDAAVFGGGIMKDAMDGIFYGMDCGVELADSGDPYYGELRTGVVYNLMVGAQFCTDQTTWDLYEGNYRMVCMPVEFTPNVRGNSSVVYTNTYHKAEYEDGSVTVTPIAAIPYMDLSEELKEMENLPEELKEMELPADNYFIMLIQAPREFRAAGYSSIFSYFVYENAIQGAGGHVFTMPSEGVLGIIFPVSDNKNKTFTIRWEEGYTETYTVKLEGAELQADPSTAVAPKSLAFNAVNTNMSVGETQQLDVKIGREQSDDVILLNYQVVSGTDVISVTEEDGVVTALKTGSAVVEVYPVRKTREGACERITGFSKKTTVTIKVGEVTAPKITLVKCSDTEMELMYKVPSDGYRREVYVLPGKGLTAADFETLIAESGNADFDGLWYYVPSIQELVGRNDLSDYGKDLMYCYMEGLQPNKDYTVYVRNVSEVRETAEGQKVAASVSGSVKSFKTAKKLPDDGEIEFTGESKQKMTWNGDMDRYEADLSMKTAKIETWLMYPQKELDQAADDSDENWLTYPLTQRQQSAYQSPKLEYCVLDIKDLDNDICSEEKKGEFKYYFDGAYRRASKAATVDKKGNVKLKGAGDVVICASDPSGNVELCSEALHISSAVDKITAKKLTLKAGSRADIYESLVFYNGKTKITGTESLYEWYGLNVEVSDKQAVRYEDGYLYAMQPNRKVDITVSLADDPSVKTVLQVTTKDIDAVKGVKIYDVTDQDARVSFTHTGNGINSEYYDECYFKVTVKDARGRVVDSAMLNLDNGNLYVDDEKSDLLKGKFFYVLYLYDLNLKPQSSYTISIAPVYRDCVGKEMTKKFKTTKVPASYYNLHKDEYGGMDLWVPGYDNSVSEVYFISGNTYTLYAGASGVEDKLTWKTSDKKVGTVKADNGGYSATFRALKAGATDIEVTSAITKKVISRQRIVILPVGSGGGSFGTLEPVNMEYCLQQNGVTVMTLEDPARIRKNYFTDGNLNSLGARHYIDGFVVSFTAPYDGYFTFGKAEENVMGHVMFSKAYKLAGQLYDDFDEEESIEMQRGETIELYLYAQSLGYLDTEVTVSAERFANRLTTLNSVGSKETPYIIFVAPEDNYYTFSASKENKTASCMKEDASTNVLNLYNEANAESQKTNNSIALSKGERVLLMLRDTTADYTVSVKGRTLNRLSQTAVSTGDIQKGEEKWYVYTAPAIGTYTVSSAKANGVLKADYYTSAMDAEKTATLEQIQTSREAGNDFSGQYQLGKGQQLVLRVYTESETAVKAEISVSQPEMKMVQEGKNAVVSMEDQEAWLSFVVPEDTTEYTFDVAYEQADNNAAASYVAASFYKNGFTESVGTYGDKHNKICGLKKGDVIYIKLTSNVEEVTVSVKASKAESLTVGKAVSLTAEDGGIYFYSFKAPSYGLYTISSQVTEGEHSLQAETYSRVNSSSLHNPLGEAVGNGFYAEREMATGEELIFAVQPGNTFNGSTKASVLVNRVEAAVMSEKQDELQPHESKWYRYTAPADGSYVFSWSEDKAVVTYAASLRANIGTAYVSGASQKLQNGKSLYFKVSNPTDEKILFGFEVSVTKTALPEGALDIKAGETKQFKYTAEKTGFYTLTWETGESETAESEENLTVRIDDLEYTNGREFEMYTGDTIEISVSATQNTSVTFKVEPFEPETLTENSIILPAYVENKWGKFTIPATGRYKVYFQGENIDEVMAYCSKDSMMNTETFFSDLYEAWLTKGVYYCRMQNSSFGDARVSVQVTEIQPAELTAGADMTAVTLNPGEEKWFRFRAEEAGIYHLLTEKNGITVTGYKNTENDALNLSDVQQLSKNEWIDIKLYLSRWDTDETAKTASIGVRKVESTEVKEKTPLTVTAASGVTQYLEFVVPSTGYYSFTVELPDNVRASMKIDGSTYNFDADSRYVHDYNELTIGTTLLIPTTLNYAASEEVLEEKSIKVVVEKVLPQEMGQSAEGTVEKGVKTWFVFTAPRTDRYFFEDQSEVQMQYQLYKDEIGSDADADETSFPADYLLQKGQKLYLAAYYDGTAENAPAEAAFKINVGKVTVKAMGTDDYTDTLEPGAVGWYSYTAPEFNNYTFRCTSGDDEVPAEIFYSFLDEDGSSFSSCYKGAFGKQSICYIRVKNNTTDEMSLHITAARPATAELNKNGVTEVSLEESDERMYLAEIDKSGYYIISREDAEDGVSNMICFWNNGTSGRNIYDEDEAFYFKKGETVGICVSTIGGAGSTQISLREPEVCEGNFTITLEEDGVKYIQWKLSEDGEIGTYRLYMSYNGNGIYSVRYTSNSESGVCDGYLSSSNHQKYNGRSYVLLRVSGTAGASVGLRVEKEGSFGYKGVIGESVPVTVSFEEGNGVYFVFTAPQSGEYVFYSSDYEDDPYGILYNSEYRYINHNDDGRDGRNFQIERSMTEGETVYLAVRGYDWDSDRFTVHVESR